MQLGSLHAGGGKARLVNSALQGCQGPLLKQLTALLLPAGHSCSLSLVVGRQRSHCLGMGFFVGLEAVKLPLGCLGEKELALLSQE